MMAPIAPPAAAPPAAPFCVFDMFEQLKLDVASASTRTLVAIFLITNPPRGLGHPMGASADYYLELKSNNK
jgi:hypothetical protein